MKYRLVPSRAGASALALALLLPAACSDDSPGDVHVPLAVATDEDVPVALDVPADPVDPSATYTATAPSHGTVAGTGSSLTYTPAADYFGTDTFQVAVSLGRSTTTVDVTVTVAPVNDAPLATAQNANTAQGTPVEITLEASDVDSTTLTYVVTNDPAHGTLTGTPPAVTYVPAPGFVGSDAFAFTVSDGSLTSAAAFVTVYVAGCGSGVVEGDEACDDGNDDDSDDCPTTCAEATCGDGYVRDGVELCDDGNLDDTDDCLSTCTTASCGDGVVQQVVEECDDGGNGDEDDCLDTCVAASCGDGYLHEGVEQCDDGDVDSTDDCTVDCEAARCGDGYVYAGIEQCDDGDSNGPGHRCNFQCVNNVCGDGDVGPGETCDDGNLNGGDGCSPGCMLEESE